MFSPAAPLQVREDACDPLAEEFDDFPPPTNGSTPHLGGAPDLPPLLPERSAIIHMDYSSAARMLVLVLGDGSAAMCRTPDGELCPLDQLQFSHWLCGPEAR